MLPLGSIVCVITTLSLSIALAQGSAPTRVTPQTHQPATKKPAPSVTVLTNEDVIKMVRAGLGEAVVIGAIRKAAHQSFRLDADSLILLKQSGVSDNIVSAMLNGGVTSSPQPVLSPSNPAAPIDGRVPAETADSGPETPRQAGIYVSTGAPKSKLIALEPTTFSQGKSGGFFTSAITYGIKKVKWKAIVRSGKANFRISEILPNFYFYFEQTGSGLSHSGGFAGWMSGASSPNEFVLVRMTEKDRERELIVGEFGAFGASTGTRSKDTVDMKIEKISAGIYRVTPAAPLPAGEYCFFYASGASTFGGGAVGKLFDFGIDPVAPSASR